MTTSLGPSPGHRKHPDHTIRIQPHPARVTVRIGGETIADSANVLQLDEQGYACVLYFPPSDVHVEGLQPSSTRTRCPFKGEASYFAKERGGVLLDVAWCYSEVYDEVQPIAGYLAFYADRVDITTESGPGT